MLPIIPRIISSPEYSLRNVLQFRELALSAGRGNKDSFIGIGNLYYERARSIKQSGIKSSSSDGYFLYIYERVVGLFFSPITIKMEEGVIGKGDDDKEVINKGGNEEVITKEDKGNEGTHREKRWTDRDERKGWKTKKRDESKYEQGIIVPSNISHKNKQKNKKRKKVKNII